jgi:hypothetical protein
MPSDDRVTLALRALAGPQETFRSAVALAHDQVRALLAAHTMPEDGAGRAATELGSFAAGRIDADRFAQLFSGEAALDPEAVKRIAAAAGVLRELLAEGDELFVLRLEPGADLRTAVDAALGRAGRAFGAARTVELVRTGRFRAAEHDALLASCPPRRWNRAERQIAPPLVVELDGADLRAAALADLLDGTQALVLVARGDAPPAPLVRLISPGMLVIQTDDPAELDRLARRDGPAIAALLPEGASIFVHDPRAGADVERLAVCHLPAAEPDAPLGDLTAFQQTEELRQLALLAALHAARAALATGNGAAAGTAAPAAASAPAATAAPATTAPADGGPAELLAAWILRQADLSDPAG